MKNKQTTSINTLEAAQSLVQNKKAFILYFMNDTCAPCLALRPKVETLLEKYPEMQLIYIDSRKNPEISGAYNVFSNPSLLLFFEGKESVRFSKYVSVDQLEEAIKRPYGFIFG